MLPPMPPHLAAALTVVMVVVAASPSWAKPPNRQPASDLLSRGDMIKPVEGPVHSKTFKIEDQILRQQNRFTVTLAGEIGHGAMGAIHVIEDLKTEEPHDEDKAQWVAKVCTPYASTTDKRGRRVDEYVPES